MKITYDKEADAAYIELEKGEFDKNKKVSDDIIFDLDKNSHILGIEVLDASKKLSEKLLTLGTKN